VAIYVKKISFISIFSLFFWFSNMILSDALILPVSQLQTQQVMTSHIKSHIKIVRVLIFQSKMMKILAIMAAFNTV